MDESPAAKEAWEFVQALNRAWVVERDADALSDYFHERMVAISASDRERRVGRAACVADWKGFVEAATILRFEQREPLVHVYADGRCAVVSYYYDMAFEIGGQTIQAAGRDMFTLAREDGRWWAVADHFSAFPR